MRASSSSLQCTDDEIAFPTKRLVTIDKTIARESLLSDDEAICRLELSPIETGALIHKEIGAILYEAPNCRRYCLCRVSLYHVYPP
jgi:hypothetical protein